MSKLRKYIHIAGLVIALPFRLLGWLAAQVVVGWDYVLYKDVEDNPDYYRIYRIDNNRTVTCTNSDKELCVDISSPFLSADPIPRPSIVAVVPPEEEELKCHIKPETKTKENT